MDTSYTTYKIHFYEGENQIYAYYTYAPPNIKVGDIIHLAISEDRKVTHKIRADYKVLEIVYSFEQYVTPQRDVYIEILVEKIP